MPLQEVLYQSQGWIVPAGKVAIIDDFSIMGDAPNDVQDEVRIFLPLVSGNSQLYITRPSRRIPDPGKAFATLYLAAGSRVSNPSTYNIMIVGRLADEADLYASVSSGFDGVVFSGGRLNADLNTSSPRPVSVRIEESSDLRNWRQSDVANVSKNGTGSFNVDVATGGASKMFIRATVKPRSK